LFVGEEVVSARSSKEANFGGAIREWASAPPAITLVAKTRGALTGFLRAYGEKFPDIGKFAGQCAETVNRRSAELEVQFAIAKLQRIAHSGERPYSSLSDT
jgi:hypothetical protein